MDHNQASLLESDEVARVLGTDPRAGLSLAEAQLRLKKHGPNKLGEHSEASNGLGRRLLGHLIKFLKQFLNPLIQLLLLCVVVSAAIGECHNSLSILAAILIVCAISYLQERHADKSLEKLSGQMPATCEVIRERQTYEIAADHLVPGDVVHLAEGRRVPADLRLFDLCSLTVNEANLTGETQSQMKTAEAIPRSLMANLLSGGGGVESGPAQEDSKKSAGAGAPSIKEASELARASAAQVARGTSGKQFMYQNLALMGTVVESGHSRGLVIATGESTRYGEVYSLLRGTQQPRSPLQTNIDQLAIHLVVLACLVIAAIAILGIVQQRAPLEVTYYAISLAVTAIPEGLPVVVAVIMALGVVHLSRQRTIVKSPHSIETLGCMQVLCTDKTGTLTRNDMTLTDIVTSELHSLSSGELEQLNNEECIKQMTFNKFGGKMYALGRLMEVATLCNNATIDQSHQDQVAAAAGRGERIDMRHCEQRPAGASEESGSSRNTGTTSGSSSSNVDAPPAAGANGARSFRYIGQATECALLDAAIRLGFGDSRTKFERLLEIPFAPTSRRMIVYCKRRDQPGHGPMYYVKGAWEEILADCKHHYEHGLVKARSQELWLEYARICTALGSQGLRVLALATGAALDQLVLVGLVGISNSLREGMCETVDKLRNKFHIDVKMITGDSRPTAVAIGRQLNLLDGDWASSVAGGAGAGGIGSGSAGASGVLHSDYATEDELVERHIMSGEQLLRLLSTDMDQAHKAREILSRTVFYRVDPIQKASIVAKLQDLGRVVGMTGDGVNDILSLKRANLSLVMGSGADVCKEMADVIVLDDDLSVLLAAVVEGKAIYHKIHAFMAYQVSLSLTLLLLLAIAFACEIEAPFTVVQLLFINILADGPPAQALAMEQLSENELSMWPRNVHDPIVSCRLLGTLLVLTTSLLAVNGGLYAWLLDDRGTLEDDDDGARAHIGPSGANFTPPFAPGLTNAAAPAIATGGASRARTLLFTCFVFSTIFAALSLKSKFKTIFETRLYATNKHLLACCLLVGALQIAATQTPYLSDYLQLEPLKPLELVYVILYAGLVLVLMDSLKVLGRFCVHARHLAAKALHKLHSAATTSTRSSLNLYTNYLDQSLGERQQQQRQQRQADVRAGQPQQLSYYARRTSGPALPQVVVPSLATVFENCATSGGGGSSGSGSGSGAGGTLSSLGNSFSNSLGGGGGGDNERKQMRERLSNDFN